VEDIAHGAQVIIKEVLNRMSITKVILLGVLPRPQPYGAQCQRLNKLLAKLGNHKNVFFLDMWSQYVLKDGQQNYELFIDDKLHIDEKGYDVWAKTMEPLLNKLYPGA